MQLQIRFPDTFPLHGVERDAFEAKLRDALHYDFDGRRVRRLAEQVDARRPFEPSDVLPLRRIGDEHTFEQCMTLERCRFDDMSMALRRVVMHAIAARLGLELSEPGIATGIVGHEEDATNRPSSRTPPLPCRARTVRAVLAITAGTAGTAGTAAGVLVTATAMWKIASPADTASMVVTVVSTSPAQTLRDLATSVPDDRRPYRVSVQVEPRGTDTGSH